MSHMTPLLPSCTDHRQLMKPAKLHLLALLGAALLTALPSVTHGQKANNNPPTQLTYQGFLTDATGAPLGASAVNKIIQFRIFAAESGGTALWASSQVVTVDKGHFSVLLGQGSQVGSEPFSNDLSGLFTDTGTRVSDRYLELTVDGAALAPRLRFLPAPYAMLAHKAMTVDSTALPNHHIVRSNASGHITLRDHFIFNSPNGVINWGGTGALFFRQNTVQGDIDGHATRMIITSAGSVGIGTITPNAKLQVVGDMRADRFFGSGADITDLSAGSISSGTLAVERIPGLDATKITAGTLNSDRLPTTITGDRTFTAKVRIDHAFSMGGANAFEIDAPGAIGGRFMVNRDGYVGIGTASPTQAKLVVNGSANLFRVGPYSFLSTATTGYGFAGQLANYSIYASDRIAAQEINIFSDARLKNREGRSDSARDLDILNGIEITDYRHKDIVAKGSRPQKKVIAQQVEAVYPQAVNQSTDVVPDIYQKATHKDGWVQLATDLKIGERVKLIGEKEEGIHEVLEVKAGAFRTAFKSGTEKVFVYGREVKDFRSVDYEAIAMLNVSATQELARQNKALQKRVSELESRERQVVALQKRVDELEGLERQLADLQKLVRQVAERQNPRPRAAVSENGPASVLPVSGR